MKLIKTKISPLEVLFEVLLEFILLADCTVSIPVAGQWPVAFFEVPKLLYKL